MITIDERQLPLISVIIPVFNEEENILAAYEAIKALFASQSQHYRMEILFSDNHSTDRTIAKLEDIAVKDSAVKVIRLARNFGFQRSVLTAYHHVTGDAAVQIDCDLQDPPEIILEFLKLWETGYDVVVGVRRGRREARSLHFLRRLFYRLVRKISDDNMVDDAGDFRLVDRSVIDRLKEVRDARPYTRGLISSLAARQIGVTYDRAQRQFGQSKFPFRRLFGLAADGIVNHSIIPLRLSSIIGLLIFLTASALTVFYAASFFLAGQTWPEGFVTLTLLVLFSIGINAVLIGILGEYVGRIYDEVRVRPLTIIEYTINIETGNTVQHSRTNRGVS